MSDDPIEDTVLKFSALIKRMSRNIVIYNKSVLSKEDLCQAGYVALLLAIKSYNPSLGSFDAYARTVIKNGMLDEANSLLNIFTVNHKIKRLASKVSKLHKTGLDDSAIMRKLGIKTELTYQSLLKLSKIESTSLIEE